MESYIQEPMAVLAVLLAVLAALFGLDRHPEASKVFKVVPLLVFAYFVPTILSNTGLIPLDGDFVLYEFIKDWLLPASLVLLILAVDVPAIVGLGRNAGLLFLVGTGTIVVGGPLAMLLFGWMLPADMGEQAWKGLAALSGSWIGGGANFTAIGESVGATDSTLSLMVVVDVAVANVWMAILLSFAAREKEMDARIEADRTTVDECLRRVEEFQGQVARPTNLPDVLLMLAVAFGGTALAHFVGPRLPQTDLIGGFTWVVILVTALGLSLSFTSLRSLEGAGASALGSVFLYLLVATIGAKAEFSRVFEPQNAVFVLVGAVWMMFHGVLLLLVRRWLKAPIFFAAVGSQANVGGAASAPIVASVFHPSLAPVGVLLAIAGYVMGVYGGLVCAALLRAAYFVWH
ncbi:MAG: DUF819 domain-containing protein [Vulcanimicrobiota bacterium]